MFYFLIRNYKDRGGRLCQKIRRIGKNFQVKISRQIVYNSSSNIQKIKEDLAIRDKWVESISAVIGYYKKIKKNQPKKIEFDKSDKARKWKW